MAVGCLLHGQVIPAACIGVIRPCNHVGKQIRRSLRETLQHTVYQRHGFCTGNLILGTECIVAVAAYPAMVRRNRNLAFCPMPDDIGEVYGRFVAVVVKACCDCRKFRTRDGCVRAECPIGIPCDNAHSAQRGNGTAIPCVRRHIGEIILMCEVFTADTILKQTEEDCRYLCTGDGILRLYFAIPVTNDVSKVVSVVQTQCVIIRNFYCRLRLGTMSAAATATGGFLGVGYSDYCIRRLVGRNCAGNCGFICLVAFDSRAVNGISRTCFYVDNCIILRLCTVGVNIMNRNLVEPFMCRF